MQIMRNDPIRTSLTHFSLDTDPEESLIRSATQTVIANHVVLEIVVAFLGNPDGQILSCFETDHRSLVEGDQLEGANVFGFGDFLCYLYGVEGILIIGQLIMY